VTHPIQELDDLVHQRVRLGILAVLHEADRVAFTTLGELLGLTAGNLSRNLRVLEEHHYVRIEKAFENRRPRTWVQATPEGLAALEREATALRDLLHRLESPEAPPRRPRRSVRGTGSRPSVGLVP
jgi:DNA-binding MarR family transcriptional regulator